MGKEQKTIQINSVVVGMELLAGIYEYINQINRPFTEKEPYIIGIRDAINAQREVEEAKLREAEESEKKPEPKKD